MSTLRQVNASAKSWFSEWKQKMDKELKERKKKDRENWEKGKGIENPKGKAKAKAPPKAPPKL